MKIFTRLFYSLLLLLLVLPGVAAAQGSDWRERRTDKFAILYVDSNEQTASDYAGFVDAIYDEVAGVFGHTVATPVTLRLYPTRELYVQANPLARDLPGVIAHADYRRNEVVVIIEQTLQQTPDEVQNNIRHELTHIAAAEMSENRLNVYFQEGIAQYLEHPSRELEAKIGLLRDALKTDRLMGWSDLDDRDAFYGNPNIGYPQSLSTVAFLIERYSFAKFREFLTIVSRSSGPRSALERTYNASPTTLEQEWRAWLPGYLDGGYRQNMVAAYDMSRAESLVQQGSYDEAERELAAVIDWLRQNDRAEDLKRAEALLDQVAIGRRGEQLAGQARDALANAEYQRAAALVSQAQATFAEVGDQRQAAVLADYAARAGRGVQAEAALRQAQSLADSLRYPQAREMADVALAQFSAIGADQRASEARALRLMLDTRQTIAGAVLLIIGLGGVLASAVRRLTMREAEAW